MTSRTSKFRFLSLALGVPVVFAGCATPQPAPGAPGSSAPMAVAPPDPAARDKAQADTARLKAEADKNPMLAAWTGPYQGVPPWDQVKASAFSAAFTTGIALRAAEVTAIAEQSESPSFDNTLAALQDAGRHMDRASRRCSRC